MSIYITNPNIDDICDLGKIVSIESCKNCEYCKDISNVIRGGGRKNIGGIISIRVDCNYGNIIHK